MDIGLIGAGYWGSIWARVIAESDVANLSYVVDKDGAALQSLSEELWENYNEVPCKKEAQWDRSEGVIIATPPNTHYEIANNALYHGQNVLVEKPATLSRRDTNSLLTKAKKRNKFFMVGHTHLYEAIYEKALPVLPTLGEIRHIEGHWTGKGQVRDDVDVIQNMGPHALSVIINLAESAPNNMTISGINTLTESNKIDAASMMLRFTDHLTADITLNWYHPRKQRRLYVCGTKRDLHIDFVNKVLTRYKNETPEMGKSAEGHEEPLSRELQHFVEASYRRKRHIVAPNHPEIVSTIIEGASNGSTLP